jgi:hypothetical protein
VLLCVKSLKACIRRVIEKKLSCKLSKRMYYYTRKHGNHFYKCFMQFYIILIHKFVVSRSFKIRFCSDLSDYRPFGLLTLWTIDPSDYWPFGLLTLRTNELTRLPQAHSNESLSELQISCIFAFFTLWKRVKTHVLSDQRVHITHTYCCVRNFPNSERTYTVVYIIIHFCL